LHSIILLTLSIHWHLSTYTYSKAIYMPLASQKQLILLLHEVTKLYQHLKSP